MEEREAANHQYTHRTLMYIVHTNITLMEHYTLSLAVMQTDRFCTAYIDVVYNKINLSTKYDDECLPKFYLLFCPVLHFVFRSFEKLVGC